MLRTEKVRPMLKEVVDDLEMCCIRFADAEDCSEHHQANIGFLEEQIRSLQLKLLDKYREKEVLEASIVEAHNTVDLGCVATPGLCLRWLSVSPLCSVSCLSGCWTSTCLV